MNKLKKRQSTRETVEQFYVPCDCACTCTCSSSPTTKSSISSYAASTERASDKAILN